MKFLDICHARRESEHFCKDTRQIFSRSFRRQDVHGTHSWFYQPNRRKIYGANMVTATSVENWNFKMKLRIFTYRDRSLTIHRGTERELVTEITALTPRQNSPCERLIFIELAAAKCSSHSHIAIFLRLPKPFHVHRTGATRRLGSFNFFLRMPRISWNLTC